MVLSHLKVISNKSNLDLCYLFGLISPKWYMISPMLVWNTYTKSSMIFWFTFDNLLRSNQGDRPFKGLYRRNGVSDDQSLYMKNIYIYGVLVWSFKSFLWAVFHKTKHVMTKVY